MSSKSFLENNPEIFLFTVVEHVRLGPQGNRPVKVTKPKVFITTGADVPLKGMCLMFNRVRPQNEVTEDNISQVKHEQHLTFIYIEQKQKRKRKICLTFVFSLWSFSLLISFSLSMNRPLRFIYTERKRK